MNAFMHPTGPLDELHRPQPPAVGCDVGGDPLRRFGHVGQVEAEQLRHALKRCGDRPYAPVDSTRAQRELHHLTHQLNSKANAHSRTPLNTRDCSGQRPFFLGDVVLIIGSGSSCRLPLTADAPKALVRRRVASGRSPRTTDPGRPVAVTHTPSARSEPSIPPQAPGLTLNPPARRNAASSGRGSRPGTICAG
jgi:hypothetical protein